MTENEEDHRAQREGICGVKFIGATGIEWICIKPVHDKVYKRRTASPRHQEYFFSNAPQVDMHYMVNRWPNRKIQKD